ncbi:hypothetical protein [Halobacterium yunchengense]|uniref:hypothetical protein n=1 Tax=Halobacterium yunchengense TaxID=3108497 RepID=UPI00300B9697
MRDHPTHQPLEPVAFGLFDRFVDAGKVIAALPRFSGNSPTTITTARDRQGFAKSTAYKYANTLAEPGVEAENGEHEGGSPLLHADPVYGAINVDEDIGLFVDRHGNLASYRQ